MKTHIGSLQRRGRRYYLVLHREGRQKWFALKTEKLAEARIRAASLAPVDSGGEEAWLRKLVREGELARMRLARLRARRELTWENLSEHARLNVDAEASSENRACHVRWLALLAEAARTTGSGETPGGFLAGDILCVCGDLGRRYLSAPRMLAYFRRVWSSLGLDADVWPTCVPSAEKRSEHYRRLTVEEISRIHAYLAKRVPALADMVLIGYATGLRLSDVAELELSEVRLPFLRVCPNKTRRHKPNPLRIPLVGWVREMVARRAAAAERSGQTYLFSSAERHRPSRRIVAAFRHCGVCKCEDGRASFHSLRATFISLMDEAGVPPHVTDSITGHGGGGMHARYTQPSDDALLLSVLRAIPVVGHSTPLRGAE